MDHCRKIFEEFLDIHDENCLREVEGSARVRVYKKKEIVIREGEIQSEIPFIISGSVIGYYLDEGERKCADCIVDFYGAPITAASDLEAFIKPSDVYLEALERTEAVCVPTETIIHIIMAYPEVKASMQRLVTYFLTHHRKMQRMNSAPLPQRYQMFKELFPELSGRLNMTSTAMCLNTSVSALSRLLGEGEK